VAGVAGVAGVGWLEGACHILGPVAQKLPANYHCLFVVVEVVVVVVELSPF